MPILLSAAKRKNCFPQSRKKCLPTLRKNCLPSQGKKSLPNLRKKCLPNSGKNILPPTHPDTPVVQMDTVMGPASTGEPVLLTIHFVEAELMLAFKREGNTARSVIDVVDGLWRLLGEDAFRELFPLVLTDNGPEFSSPSRIEADAGGAVRTRLFYTDPGAPYQKGACENNHSLIRRVIKSGTSLKHYSQADISLLMNHINSYTRKKLNHRSAFDVFSLLHEPSLLDLLGIVKIDPDEVTLNPSLFKK
jgi:transposase InsO family protein